MNFSKNFRRSTGIGGLEIFNIQLQKDSRCKSSEGSTPSFLRKVQKICSKTLKIKRVSTQACIVHLLEDI